MSGYFQFLIYSFQCLLSIKKEHHFLNKKARKEQISNEKLCNYVAINKVYRRLICLLEIPAVYLHPRNLSKET